MCSANGNRDKFCFIQFLSQKEKMCKSGFVAMTCVSKRIRGRKTLSSDWAPAGAAPLLTIHTSADWRTFPRASFGSIHHPDSRVPHLRSWVLWDGSYPISGRTFLQQASKSEPCPWTGMFPCGEDQWQTNCTRSDLEPHTHIPLW